MADEHDIALAAERRRAVRALLAEPLLRPDDDAFALVRRHADWLKTWFAAFLGYRLVVEAGFARLFKAGLGPGGGRTLTRPTGASFTPRMYAYLTLAVAVLVTSAEQVLLSQLVADVRAAAVEAGIDLGEVDRPVERRALGAALRQLVRWRVLVEEQGSVAGFADDGRTEALLTVDRDVAAHLLATPLGRTDSPDAFLAAASAAGPGGTRHAVRRRLVETPVVYVDDLTAAQRAWLRREQRREERSFAEYVGLQTELRTEGAALVDPDDELSEVAFPGTGTVAQAALLCVEALVAALRPDSARLRPGSGPVVGVPVPEELFDTVLAGLVERHRRHWAGAYVDDPVLLREAVTGLLVQMRLLAPAGTTTADIEDDETVAAERAVDARRARGEVTPGGFVLLAAAARYAVRERSE